MTETNLNFAKIVANPTSTGWSQVYGAGKLFAAISLETEAEKEEKDYLNFLGKEILNTLEQEFFTLEIKNLESIRKAVLATTEKIPDDVTLSFVIGVVVNNVLYVYILGNGIADIKRANNIGTLLEVKEQNNRSLKEASGYLQDLDTLILQTNKFSDVISHSTLSEFLDKPIEEAAENLAPLIHEKENPAAACIIVHFKEPVASIAKEEEIAEEGTQKSSGENLTPIETEADLTRENEKSNVYFAQPQNDKQGLLPKPFLNLFSVFKKISISKMPNLSHSKKLILLIVVIIVLIFVFSIFFALKKQQADKIQNQFNSIYPQAEKKYEEGQSLVDLNQSLANDSFKQAKDILESGKSDFPKDSSEEKQISALLSKVNEALLSAAKSTAATAQPVANSESFYLSSQVKNSASYFTKDDKNVYLIDSKTISQIANGSSTSKTLVKNNNDWKTVGGLATYNTNMYVLDKDTNQILKFINNGTDYSKADYFPASVTPDFTKAVAITIDNNIYVLYTDGGVAKYFKGNSVDFSLKGLDKPLSNPTRIYSNPDFDNIYILDNGNSRIVVFDKTGSFKAQYNSAVIKNAKDFEVLETDKKIYILSDGKIYKINL